MLSSRLFGVVQLKKTEIMTEFSLHADNKDGESASNATLSSKSLHELRWAYDVVNKRVDIFKAVHPNCTLSIEVKGVLDGNEVALKFDDINKYRTYLEENGVLSKSYVFTH